ncbi:MAG TPA: hypothetical protein VGF72_09540 [Gaiellaceae bacterium]
MEAARALADLVEISPQIEAAAVVAGDGELAGSVGIPEGAGAFRGEDGRVTQLHVALAAGDLFTVTGADERTIVAVTRERATAGLVFYDLKRCLAAMGESGAS